jgi:hypothetical protein
MQWLGNCMNAVFMPSLAMLGNLLNLAALILCSPHRKSCHRPHEYCGHALL